MNRPIAALFAVAALTAAAGPAAADPAATRAEVAGFVQDTQAGRLKTLTDLLDAKGLPYEIQAFAGGKKGASQEGKNVVVTLGQGERDLVLGAHYDAVMLKEGRLADGLTDNAGSVVALVQAAEALKGEKLHHRVRVIFFDQEELGLIGSAAYLKTRKPGEIAAAVVFDVNAYGDTVIFGDQPAVRDGAPVKALRELCGRRGLDCIGFPQYADSDDLSFTAAGVPVVSIAHQPAVDAHQMWLAMNGGKASGLAPGFVPPVFKLIHSPADRLEQVDPLTVEATGKLAVDMILELDAALKP